MPIPDLRRIDGRPGRNGSFSQPGQVPTGIQGAGAPRPSGDPILPNPSRERHLLPWAWIRSRTKAVARILCLQRLARLAADMPRILPHDPDLCGLRGRNPGLARFVVEVVQAGHLLAQDLPGPWFCVLATVGLKTKTQGKVRVALVAQLLVAEDLARAYGGEVVLSAIHAHHKAGCQRHRVGAFDGEVEIPTSWAEYQLGLLGLTRGQEALRVFARAQGQGDAPNRQRQWRAGCARTDDVIWLDFQRGHFSGSLMANRVQHGRRFPRQLPVSPARRSLGPDHRGCRLLDPIAVGNNMVEYSPFLPQLQAQVSLRGAL